MILDRWREWRAGGTHRRSVASLPVDTEQATADSLVIPAVGLDFVAEGVLAARFAAAHCPSLKEILIVSDQASAVFPTDLDRRVRVVTVDLRANVPAQHTYRRVYLSRLVKIGAALRARGERVLLTDSDLLLLREPILPWRPDVICGCFRNGHMSEKIRAAGMQAPQFFSGTQRYRLPTHLNGALLCATPSTWRKLVPVWTRYYQSIWTQFPDNQPPTDQLPLCAALDTLGIVSADLGGWVNWSVSKNIGGRRARVPSEVVGAHGGFPAEEWEKYLADPRAELQFLPDSATRAFRYKTDKQLQGME
jgi:hypothetical protein